ncbi:hypothetical protein ACIQEY_15520 [Streptomyces parvus]|uniref:hypothetical protein n=1 Tax=Streptomyces parvus TaxID=66428 RepID=UPI0037F4F0E2
MTDRTVPRDGEVDVSMVTVDSTTVRAHPDAAGMQLGGKVFSALIRVNGLTRINP